MEDGKSFDGNEQSIKQVVLGPLADTPGEGGSEWPEQTIDRRLISWREFKERTEMGGTLSPSLFFSS